MSMWSSGCKKVCKVCDCDYYLTEKYTCALLPAYCKSADKYGSCVGCIRGYYLNGDKVCVQIP